MSLSRIATLTVLPRIVEANETSKDRCEDGEVEDRFVAVCDATDSCSNCDNLIQRLCDNMERQEFTSARADEILLANRGLIELKDPNLNLDVKFNKQVEQLDNQTHNPLTTFLFN